MAEIRIAVAAPLTGQFAPLGEAAAAGAREVAEGLKTVGGETLVVEVYDDGCDAAKAEALANQLVGRGVKLVVGHLCSGAASAAAQVYADHDIVAISPGAISAKFTDERAGPTIFRLAPRADAQGTFLGRWLADTHRGDDVAFLSDGSGYGQGLADAALAAFREAGGAPSLIETFETGARNYSGLAARLAADGAEVVLIGAYHGDVAQIGYDLGAIGPLPLIVGGDALMLDDFPSVGSAVAARSVFSAPEGLIGADEGHETYRDRAAAAIEVYAAAVAAAGSTDGAAVAAAIAAGRPETVLGEIRFDAKGDSNRPGYALYTWKDGRIVPQP
ncbi:branched-chain amino acid ABC transporter substrate-binding protein [Methylobrevis pamukkalensis]|uniref:Leucine-binding protein domain-containing protein n=1 Tax=Methylobrevis pamukkalensis TaxID=1439726 RepID=A0A1E3H3E2_9HYPH|nr:branched-chain amino acid ABC transporter substrate-binding protein [Methylobrevis pamukkalensis]ODN70655.1 hypothetical protein A6302_02007 [Methylobrevis pamukkalensis]